MNNVTNTLELREQADDIVRSHMLWSIGSGIIPLPLLDLAALTALQVGMIEQLAKLYDVDYRESSGKNFVRALTGTAFARVGASLIKVIPGIGTMTGAVAMSIASGASTYALGQVIINQFENSISLDEVDLNAAKATYDANYQYGEKVAKDIRRQKSHGDQHAPSTQSADTTSVQQSTDDMTDDVIIARIEKLATLHEKGILSKEEFESKKVELLAKL